MLKKKVRILTGPWEGLNGYIKLELEKTVAVTLLVGSIKSVVFMDKGHVEFI